MLWILGQIKWPGLGFKRTGHNLSDNKYPPLRCLLFFSFGSVVPRMVLADGSVRRAQAGLSLDIANYQPKAKNRAPDVVNRHRRMQEDWLLMSLYTYMAWSTYARTVTPIGWSVSLTHIPSTWRYSSRLTLLMEVLVGECSASFVIADSVSMATTMVENRHILFQMHPIQFTAAPSIRNLLKDQGFRSRQMMDYRSILLKI